MLQNIKESELGGECGATRPAKRGSELEGQNLFLGAKFA